MRLIFLTFKMKVFPLVFMSYFRSIGAKVGQSKVSFPLKSKVVVGVYVDKITRLPVADELAKLLSLPTLAEDVDQVQDMLIGWSEKDYLQLFWGGRAILKEKPFYIDFFDDHYLRRKESLSHELSLKALGKIDQSIPTVWDMTAGLGRDSLIFLFAGWNVVMFERHPILGALLSDGVNRFLRQSSQYQNRLNLIVGEAVLSASNSNTNFELCATSQDPVLQAPAVVFLDPMYPTGFTGRKSQVKKYTQMLHRLIGHEEGLDEQNNSQLFQVALSKATNRVVVKRPKNAPNLAGAIPHAVLEGTSQRYDIYFKNQNVIFQEGII